MRIGLGYDIHALKAGRKLVLGGVEIPFDKGLDGHSDADVLLHAMMDALLGALALGDIGTHFPNTDPAFKNANSLDLLKQVAKIVAREGYVIRNVDATLIAEAPKIMPFVGAMRQKISEALAIDIHAVSIKATTNEGIGCVGRGEGMAAQAVALVVKQ